MYYKRLVDKYLSEWKDAPDRKPLILRGARQVGKSSAVRQLGSQFDHFVEVNFEENTALSYAKSKTAGRKTSSRRLMQIPLASRSFLPKNILNRCWV